MDRHFFISVSTYKSNSMGNELSAFETQECRQAKLKSPALWAGLLSGYFFVKRDAEPSEGECSLGEFFAEILQRLTQLHQWGKVHEVRLLYRPDKNKTV